MDFAIEEGSRRPLLGGLAHGHDWRSVRRGWRGGLWCSCQCAQRRGCFQHLDQERWRQEREDSVSLGRDAIAKKAADTQIPGKPSSASCLCRQTPTWFGKAMMTASLNAAPLIRLVKKRRATTVKDAATKTRARPATTEPARRRSQPNEVVYEQRYGSNFSCVYFNALIT